MSHPRWRHGLGAVLGGALLLLAIVMTTPDAVEIDIGGHEPAQLTGVHGAEEHYGRHIRWTDGATRIEWTGQFGVVPTAVEVELAAFFGRAGEQVAVAAGTRTVRHRLSGDWDIVRVPLADRPGGVVVDVHSEQHNAPGDPRPLGVRLDRVTVVNGSSAHVLTHVRWSDAFLVVLAGAFAYLGGAWVAAGRPRRRPFVTGAAAGLASLAVAAMTILWWRTWLLQPSGLRALAAAGLLGASVVALLVKRGGCTRGMSALVGTAAAIAWFVCATWSAQHFVDVPRWDIWETVPLIEKALDGTLSPADMWSGHNDHRPMTGRMLVIGTALVAHWNHWYEMAALQAAAAALLLVLTAFVARTQRYAQRVHPATLIAIAVFVCSATQWENWLRGYHFHILMGAIAPVGALLLLADGAQRSWRLAAAAALGVLGELSFGTGLIVWPLGALVIATRRRDGWQARLGAWLAVGGVAIALYFPGLPASPGRSSGIGAVLSAVGMVKLAAGTLVTVAMPVAYVPLAFTTRVTLAQGAIVALGAVAVLTFAALVALRWREDAAREQAWVFPTALGTFGLCACVLAGLGRVSMGLYAMTASRYLLFAGCFWAGLLILLGMVPRGGPRWRRRAALVLVVLIATAGLAAWPRALPFMDADARAGRQARTQLRRGLVGEAASVLYPDPFVLERRRQVLLKHRLSIFRPGAP